MGSSEMSMLLLGNMAGALLGWLMGFLSVFLILLILIQRGKGGGLTGALGGPGGQSAFGSKAGDTFTVITIVVASFWGLTCAFTMWLLGTHSTSTATNKAQIKAGPDEDEGPAGGTSFNVPPLNSSSIGLGDPNAEPEAVELTPATNDSSPASESATDADAGEPAANASEDVAPADDVDAPSSESAESTDSDSQSNDADDN
jgi:preprotein translocase subunit SecG